MANKKVAFGICLVACIILYGWLDGFYLLSVGEDDLAGAYAIHPYKIINNGKVNYYFDTLLIKRNGAVERLEYENQKLITHYLGNWHYELEGRYSIPIDIYTNDVKPERNWLNRKIRIQISSLTYYKL
jgi:hypothetical protein